MKLLVIVLCLLSERYLVQIRSHRRFYWVSLYNQFIEKQLSALSFIRAAWVNLFIFLLPLMGVAFLILHQVTNGLFGLVGLFLNVVILYACIGPGNPFYPIRDSKTAPEDHSPDDIGTYLAEANEQLFAVLFWYILLGPLAVLGYRLISESRKQASVSQLASKLTNLFDWLPARMTALLYLLVGNFQAGLRHFSLFLIKAPENNQNMLSVCGLDALGSAGGEPARMIQAENLVEHSVIVLLVFLALFTMVAWM